MAKTNQSGLGVVTRYGPVTLPDGAFGELPGTGGVRQLTVEWSADLINSDSINAHPIIVSNILPLRAWVEVETALSLSGTSAGLALGYQGGVAANCAEITGTAVGVGFGTMTLLGEFSTGITATKTLVIGVTSGSINSGAGRIVVEYMKV